MVNPTYWGGKSSIDAIEYQVLEDQARVTALQSGQIDLAIQISYQGRSSCLRART